MFNIALYFFLLHLFSWVPCKIAAAVVPNSSGDGGRNWRGSGGKGGLDCANQFGGKTGAADECHRYRSESR